MHDGDVRRLTSLAIWTCPLWMLAVLWIIGSMRL